ncbi:hypothetical protein [Micromonospora aurantiaca (nom. illeg.)]|uniref:hypothetical protein n=1 Tax=Micromonospora aurantiaca (nom. illeg.) TaxID=47850 RepID=UPI0011AA9787|nr:hypothetical protein [Micromonospora aurantiaca]MBC9000532.1 hypothetical protein [Micromonospora aurantiaca]
MKPEATYAVSAGAGLACLVIATLLWTVGNRMLPRVTTVLVMTGVSGLITTWAGEQADGAVGSITKLIDKLTMDKLDAKVSGLIALAAFFVVAVHMWRKQVDWITLAAAALLPLAVRSATGDFGDGLEQLVKGITEFVGSIVGSFTGTGKK